MFKRFDVIFLIVVVGLAATLIAGEISESDHAGHANFDGQLVCLGCDLKGNQGARAECSVYGHDHALKTEDGKFINFLENKYSADLMAGEKYHNQQIKVHGIYFADANLIDVEWFEVDNKTKSWCDHCKQMDSCNSK